MEEKHHFPHVDIGKNCTAKYDVLLRGAIHFWGEDGGLGSGVLIASPTRERRRVDHLFM